MSRLINGRYRLAEQPDPDPRVPDGWLEDEEWRRMERWRRRAVAARFANRRRNVVRLAAAFLLGLAIGLSASIVRAAPPSGSHPSIPVAAEGRLEAPLRDIGASPPPPSPSIRMRPAATKAPLPALVRSGTASWYDDGPGLYAAAPGWRFGQTPYPVAICTFGGGRSSCVTVYVQDACLCPGGRIIDLSPAAFSALAPLSAGLVRVRVERLR